MLTGCSGSHAAWLDVGTPCIPVETVPSVPSAPGPYLRLPWRAECLPTKGLKAGTSGGWSDQQAITSCGMVCPSFYTFWVYPKDSLVTVLLASCTGAKNSLHAEHSLLREKPMLPQRQVAPFSLIFSSPAPHHPPHTREDSLEEEQDENDRTRIGWEYLGPAAALGVGPSTETLPQLRKEQHSMSSFPLEMGAHKFSLWGQ